jgi:uncharacterized membrane protein
MVKCIKMRNKNLNLFIVAFSVITLIASFVKYTPTSDLFGFEVNSWYVRTLWLLIGLVSYKRYKDKKEEEAN